MWDEMERGCHMNGREEKCIQSLAGKHEGQTPPARSWNRWDDNSTMELKGTEWEEVDSIHLAQDWDH